MKEMVESGILNYLLVVFPFGFALVSAYLAARLFRKLSLPFLLNAPISLLLAAIISVVLSIVIPMLPLVLMNPLTMLAIPGGASMGIFFAATKKGEAFLIKFLEKE